jgi:hypothetical protein
VQRVRAFARIDARATGEALGPGGGIRLDVEGHLHGGVSIIADTSIDQTSDVRKQFEKLDRNVGGELAFVSP